MSLPGYTTSEFSALMRADRRHYYGAHILRRIIGLEATARLFRLPHAGWYVTVRPRSEDGGITTTGPFKSRQDTADLQRSLSVDASCAVSVVFFWSVPPQHNRYMGFGYGGWRRPYLPSSNARGAAPVVPPSRPVMSYLGWLSAFVLALVFGRPLNHWIAQRFGSWAPDLLWASTTIVGLALIAWDRRRRRAQPN